MKIMGIGCTVVAARSIEHCANHANIIGLMYGRKEGR